MHGPERGELIIGGCIGGRGPSDDPIAKGGGVGGGAGQ